MRRYDKDLDLHPSEWRKSDKHEPVFGSGARGFFLVYVPLFVLSFPIHTMATLIVTGEIPQWLQRLLQ